MRSTITLCSTLLFLLTACGGTVSSPSAPVEAAALPEISASFEPVTEETSVTSTEATLPIPLSASITEGTPWTPGSEALPSHLVAQSVELWNGESICLLAQLEEGISLYGLEDGETVVLQIGDHYTAYALPYLTPRSILPQLYCGDFDGDGSRELLLLTYTGSGTGVSSWTLSMVEYEDGEQTLLTLSDLTYGEELTPFLSCSREGENKALITLGGNSLSADLDSFADPQIPLEPYVGTIVEYEVAGDTITVRLAVGLYQEEHIPYTLYYPAQIEAELAYDGNGFSLVSPLLSLYD